MTTRAQALLHLQNEFEALTTETQQPTTDTNGGYGPALDRAFMALGVARAALATATVSDAQEPALLALAEYYALQRFTRTLAVRSDIESRNGHAPRAQKFQQVKDLLTEAKGRCAAYGYAVDGAGGWEFGRLNLDFTEPETTA